jgi:hypothetical protein
LKKKCKGCNINKLVDKFGPFKTSKDGYSYYCKECQNKISKAYSDEYSYSIEINLRCDVCNITKSSLNFNKNRRKKNGYSDICKECSKKELKKQRENNKLKNSKDTIAKTFIKKCSSCKIQKLNSEFNFNKINHDGLQSICRDCSAKAMKKHRDKNRSKNQNGITLSVEEKTCNKCKLLLPINLFGKRIANNDGLSSICKDCDLIKTHKRREVEANSLSDVADDEIVDGLFIKQLKERYNNCCAYCENKPLTTLSIDHIIPISKGGRHAKSNLLPACRCCNSKKRDKDPEEWFKIIGKNLKDIIRK